MLNALELLDACAESYESPSVVAGPFGRDGALIRILPDGGTLLAFRGTVSRGLTGFFDWINDLRFFMDKHPAFPGRVHRGFAEDLDALWPMIAAVEPPLTITGHSLGGALALLAKVRFSQEKRWRDAPPRVVTFAAPLAGDFHFAVECERFKAPACYENPHDLVTNLPPTRLGFYPAGSRIFPDDDWKAPLGLIANHEIETGYRPWIMQQVATA